MMIVKPNGLVLAILLHLGWIAPAAADDAAILADVSKTTDIAIAQHRIFLNCAYLQPDLQDYLIKTWTKDVDETSKMLLDHAATRDFVPGFQERAAIPALMMRDTPNADLEAFCAEHVELLEGYARLDFIIMRFALDDVLKRAD